MTPRTRRRRRHLLAALAATTLAGSALLATPLAASATGDPDAEIVGAQSAAAVPGRYIVVLKDSPAIGALDDVVSALSDTYGGVVQDVFNTVLDGYATELTEQEALALTQDPRVEHVEQVQQVHALDEQPNATWGIDRVDQRDLPLDSVYRYPADAGAGANLYVLDTGVRLTHSEFTGRIKPGFDTITSGGNANDCNGHGTHVAGSAAGSTYGIAKKATITPVRVLDCQGSGDTTTLLAGIEWVSEHAVKPAVVNYSIGCGSACDIPSIDQAVRNLVATGVTWVQAAGNSNDDACRYSPQKVSEGITVGNMTSSDAKSGSSSWGSCLDIWAPGTQITSSWYTGDTATNTITGTSMASPHVAGAALLYASANPSATPAQVSNALVQNATPDTLSGSLGTGSPNRTLYTGFLSGGTTPQPGAVDLAAPGAQSGTVGQPASLQLSATGGTAPYAYSATGLPAGLSVNASTGLISGTPTAATTATVTAKVADAAGRTDQATFTWTVAAAPTSACTGTTVASGSLTEGARKASASFTRASGPLTVCLDGPDGADFDIALQYLYGSYWYTVAQGTTEAADELFSYNAGSGTYRVVVTAYSGSGAFTATIK